MAKGKRRTSSAGEATRARIIEATLQTLATDGIVGASARRIAEVGEFNQALIFYHFGSIDDLIAEAIDKLSERRMATMGPRLEAVNSLAGLAEAGRDLLAEDRRNSHMTILVQAMAGAAGEPNIGPRLFDTLEPWLSATAAALDRSQDENRIVSLISSRDLALGIAALFLGMDMLAELDPERGDVTALLDSLSRLTKLFERFADPDTLARLFADSSDS